MPSESIKNKFMHVVVFNRVHRVEILATGRNDSRTEVAYREPDGGIGVVSSLEQLFISREGACLEAAKRLRKEAAEKRKRAREYEAEALKAEDAAIELLAEAAAGVKRGI